MPNIMIDSSMLVTGRLDDGTYKWTLASRLRQMLHMAEHLFGPRDRSYTIFGIEFHEGNPKIWYPTGGDGKNIIIRLSPAAAANMSQACFQMAHETVHLLAPSGGRNATNLEEGVACYFSVYYMKQILNEPAWYYPNESYQRVLELVRPRLEENIDCIRRLRERQPSFGDMGKEDIREEFPKSSEADVCFLTSKFIRSEH